MHYQAKTNYLQYFPHQLLLKRFSKAYLRNRVLNNNAEIVYRSGQGGSLSTADRGDVAEFSRFVLEHMKGTVLLDIGCGPLPLPAYLRGPRKVGMKIIGLDPIPSNEFEGFRIVGCSEFMPMRCSSIDTVVFATSLDHVIDLDATLRETRRVLNGNGCVLVWMGDQYRPWWRRVLSWGKSRLQGLLEPYPAYRYQVFPPDVVVYAPEWAVDPFHSYHESPLNLIKIMEKYGFRLSAYEYRSKDEVFICFEIA
jgi:SAM-dependent methyltransferase